MAGCGLWVSRLQLKVPLVWEVARWQEERLVVAGGKGTRAAGSEGMSGAGNQPPSWPAPLTIWLREKAPGPLQPSCNMVAGYQSIQSENAR